MQQNCNAFTYNFATFFKKLFVGGKDTLYNKGMPEKRKEKFVAVKEN